MKILLNIFLIVVTALPVWAQKSAAELGDEAYSSKDYSEAVARYNEALRKEGVSAALYYNLGNAYYRTDSLAQAIIAYERALKLDPTDSDARANLEFVNSKIVDAQSENSSYSTVFIEKTMRLMTADGWAICTLALFAIVLVLAGFYIVSDRERLRKICFFSGIAMLFVTIGTVVITIAVTGRQTGHNEAIVIAPSTQLSTSPATPLNASQQAFLLHEGTKVEVLDSVATPLDPQTAMWYEVRVADHRAWVDRSDIEVI